MAEERICKLKGISTEMINFKERDKKRENEQSLRDLWVTTICIVGVPEDKTESGRKKYVKSMAEDVPYLLKNINLQIQEVQ